MRISDAAEFGVSGMLVDKLVARGLTEFTASQIAALRAGVCRGVNLLVAAPTSAGKTTIAELAAVEGARRGYRTVYLVSHRALAEEKFRLFTREYALPHARWFDVAIATGDHTEGEWNTGILVSTYEKYLALLCSGRSLELNGVIVIADEIQILADEHRGPEIELLCTLLQRGEPQQIVALSATISNPRDIAAWLRCAVVEVKTRDVPLQQEVWFNGHSSTCLAGTSELFEGRRRTPLPVETLDVVDHLLNARLRPILVFTMTKRRALELAEACAARRQRTADGLGYVDQLELFSEPSTLIRALTETAQKKVAFHTADLSYAERELVERGLAERLFDVVFATPTLAAGVNFPFQTVVFDSFQRPWLMHEPWLSLAEYQNMAGRAGRLGLHDKGYAVLVAESAVHFDRARTLITAQVDPLHSRFLSCSLHKTLLAIIASRAIREQEQLMRFLQGTLWWHQALDQNPTTLEGFPVLVSEALGYLTSARLVALEGNRLFATQLGIAASATGLLPSTVVELLETFRTNQEIFLSGADSWIPAVLHAVCASGEFGDGGQRQLPFSRRNQPEQGAFFWLRARSLFRDPNAVEDVDRVTNATYGLSEWINGTGERVLRNMLPSVSYGQMQQLAADAALVLDGMVRVMLVPDADCPNALPNLISTLSDRLRYGVPSDVLDTLRASVAYSVPGLGRHRAMALRAAGLALPNDILKAERQVLVKVVENEKRAEALVAALLRYFDTPLETVQVRHAARARELSVDASIVRQSYEAIGEAYEDSLEQLAGYVREWKLSKLDKGKRQAFPDFLIEFLGKVVLVECKTKQKDTATLSKEEAFAVLTKSIDFRKDHCVTIGKPAFDETSKAKANGSTEITLIRHHDFVEAILRYLANKVTAEQLFGWLLRPGYARIDQLDAIASPHGSQC